jgi:hypothetical protein
MRPLSRGGPIRGREMFRAATVAAPSLLRLEVADRSFLRSAHRETACPQLEGKPQAMPAAEGCNTINMKAFDSQARRALARLQTSSVDGMRGG